MASWFGFHRPKASTVPAPIVIVGAGQAGLQTAEALRADGYAGELLLVGREARPPYYRPPLSKGYLLGEVAEGQLTMRSPEVLARKGISFMPELAAVALDRSAQRLALSDGRELHYAGLCLATGARPRPLSVSGAQLAGVFALRTCNDAQAIADALPEARSVAVIGGGFIGLEIAAVARRLGKDVVVLEAADRLMPRAVTPLLSRFFTDLHREHGVRLELNAQLGEIAADGNRAAAVRTTDGREFGCQLVVVGIGIVPNCEIAHAAGLECERGIVVDLCSRTRDRAIVAAGDCTARRLTDGSLQRLESVQNAIEQAKSAAAALMGKERPFTANPWFWSDQYDVKLQMAGASAGHDAIVLRGELKARKFSAFYFKGDKLLAVDSVNRSSDHLQARKLLDLSVSPTPGQAADPDFNLSALCS